MKARKGKLSVRFLGHATLLISLGSKRFLTDPWLHDPVYLFGFHTCPLPPPLEELLPLDFVLLSHFHRDHFDRRTRRKLPKETPLVVPRKALFRRLATRGFSNVTALEAGGEIDMGEVRVTALSSDHRGGALTYLIRAEGRTLFFGSDTRFDAGIFRDAGARYDIDIAFLPVNGLKNLLFGREVMNPEEAAEAAVLLKAEAAVPVHHHFDYRLPPFLKRVGVSIPGTPERFVRELEKATFSGKARILEPGETWNPASDGP